MSRGGSGARQRAREDYEYRSKLYAELNRTPIRHHELTAELMGAAAELGAACARYENAKLNVAERRLRARETEGSGVYCGA